MSESSHLSDQISLSIVLCMTLSGIDVDWLRANVIAAVLCPSQLQLQQKLKDTPRQVKWETVNLQYLP